MKTEESLLIDAPLIPDPDADEELGATDIEAIADEDLEGSRMLLVRRTIESIDLEGMPGGVVQFACTFQSSVGTRFVSAQFRLRLLTPNGIKIIDLAPRTLNDPNPVEFTLNHKGQLGITSSPLPVESSIELGVGKKYVRYHCMVQGGGEGTSLARWDFKENPDRKDGISHEQVLTLTLPVTGQVTGRVIVSARLVKPGLLGSIDAIREMVLGPKPNERTYPITFKIPDQPSREGVSRFFRIF